MFSTIQWALIGVAILTLTSAVGGVWLTLHNRAEEIQTLTDKLGASDQRLKDETDTANQNAAAAETFRQQMIQSQELLRQKNIKDVQMATDMAKLQNEVSNEKPTNCVPPGILAMVDGLRGLQTRNGAGGQNSGGKNGNSAGTPEPSATTPSAADKIIAHWIGDLFVHDSTCVNNLAAISKLQTGAAQ